MIRFELFGAIALLTSDGRKVHTVLAQSKHVGMLALLAVARHGEMRREKLIGLLWPDLDDVRARNALSKAIHNCRRLLGEDSLVGRQAETVGLATSKWSIDLWDFEDASSGGDYATVLALYRKGLWLDGLTIPDTQTFDAWLEVERERLALCAFRAGQALADAALNTGALEEAARHLETLASMRSYDEGVLRQRLTLLEKQGNRAAAAEVYRTFAERLHRELETTISAESQALMAAIKTREASLGPTPVAEAEPNAPVSRASDLPARTRVLGGPSTATSQGTSTVIVRTGEHQSRGSRLRLKSVVIGAVACLMLVVVTWSFGRPGRAIRQPLRVLVMPFVNQTGDTTLAALGGWLGEGVSDALTESALADAVETATRVRFGLVGPSNMETVGRPKIDTLAKATGADAVVTGHYYVSGSRLVVVVDIDGLADSPGTLRVAEEAGPRADPSAVLPSVVYRVLGAIAAATDQRFATATTTATAAPRYDAYQEYVAGHAALLAGSATLAVERWERAYAIDSNFVTVVPFLVEFGRRGRADSLVAGLAARRALLAPYDQLMLEWVAFYNRADLEATHAASTEMIALAPRSPDAIWRFGLSATKTNRFAAAVEAFRRPELAYGVSEKHFWASIAWPTLAAHMLGNYTEELKFARNIGRRFPRVQDRCVYELRALAPVTSVEGLERALRDCLSATDASPNADKTSFQMKLREQVADELIAHGRPADGARFMGPAIVELRRQVAAAPASAILRSALGFAMLRTGEWAEALPLLEAEASAPGQRSTRFYANVGIAAVHAGDTAHTLAMLSDLLLRGDSPPVRVQRARLLANLGQPIEAIRELVKARDGGLPLAEAIHNRIGLESLRTLPEFQALMAPR